MSKNWKFKSCDEALTEKLFQTLQESLPKPFVALLSQRGCRTAEDVERFMNSSLSTLRDPFELPDMQRAVERIRHALAADEKITVFGDYDVDGICSIAILVRVLRQLGGDVSAYIPDRLKDGYGLSPKVLTTCIEQLKPTLLITVDCGTNSVEAVRQAHVRGIDVVITDHHEPATQLPDAVAIVNPKRTPEHPAYILAGVGVVFKLCHALIKTGRNAGCTLAASVDLRTYLDFVSVATVADMVPLLDENRILVRAGFRILENSCWAGWNALKKRTGIVGPFETWHAGFVFGPRINAAARVGHGDVALELFLTDLPTRADELALFLETANSKRQEIEHITVCEAIEEIDSYFDPEKDFALVIAREGWHSGVIGIVASRLLVRYGRPVVVISMDGESGRGSCRSIEAFNILEGLNLCTNILKRFGGHAMAAGIEIDRKNLEEFKVRFAKAVAAQLQSVDLQPALEIDRTITLDEADVALMNGLKRIGPFGQGNPEPIWAVCNVEAVHHCILKEKHLKLTLSDGRTSREAIGFNMAENFFSGPIDVAFALKKNRWRGQTSLQLNMKDIRPSK